ncbi:38145_t:CDS:2, partial [Gigaspora margarita]
LQTFYWISLTVHKFLALREKELGEIRALMIVRAFVTGIATVIPIFANILSFTVFVLTGGTLNPSIAFASMALINILRTPLKDLPQGISLTTDALVSIYRIQDMLLTEETEYCPKNVFGSNYAIKVENGKFLWADTSVQDGDIVEQSPCEPADNELLEPLLTDILISESCNYEQKCLSSASRYNNINLEIPRGILVAVIGSVGSGKSSLLLALIGEMKKKTGEIVFGGNISYCPQTAWIQNGTLRENITFGLPFDQEKYQRAVRACCLESDILVLPAGDLTEIGENGINLSGGQKQRVNLARAVYFDSDIILLDDPLSAVDAYVGRQIFTNCILGVLASKTRILVTHQLQLLPKVDYIIYMEDGKIAEQGTYEQLMRSNR